MNANNFCKMVVIPRFERINYVILPNLRFFFIGSVVFCVLKIYINFQLSLWKKSLGGGNSNIFMFTPKLGEDEPNFDEHIFQMGWFNHQPGDTWKIPLVTQKKLRSMHGLVQTRTNWSPTSLNLCSKVVSKFWGWSGGFTHVENVHPFYFIFISIGVEITT